MKSQRTQKTVVDAEMEMTKEKKDFASLSDSIARLITTKHKEIVAEAKQLLDLKEEEFERKNNELEERSTRLDSDKEKLALREKQFEERWRELEIHAIAIEEDRDRAAEQLRELKMKDLGFKQREEEIELKDLQLKEREEESELRRKDIDGQRKELDRILEKLEADKKKLQERIHEIDRKEKQMERRTNWLDTLSKDLERQSRELDSNRKKSDERMHKLDQKERQLDERVQLFESSKETLNEDLKKLDFRIREVNSKERELDRGLEQLKLKENSLDMKSKEIELKRNKSDNLCKEIVVDGKTLQIYLNECWQNHEKMGDEVSFLLGLSQDPAKLVLDALEGFYPPHLMKNGNGEEFSGHIVQRSCILLLEQLLKISHDVKLKPEVENEARRLSCVWITKLKPDSEHSMEILGFLLVLAIYDVASIFSEDEIFNYAKTVSHFEQVPELCCLLGMTDKIPDLVQDLVERKQHLVAIRYAFSYNMVEKLGSLLKDYLETSKIESAAIMKSGNYSYMAQSRARTRMISDLTAAIACIEKYNISSEYSPANLRQMIANLYKQDELEQKAVVHAPAAAAVAEAPQFTCSSIPVSSIDVWTDPLTKKEKAVVHAPAAAAVAEAPQLQQTGTSSSVPVSSKGPEPIVSAERSISEHVWTDPLPKRRKLLDGKSISTDNTEPKKQVCGNEKDLAVLLRQNLDFCLMRTQVVGILRSSANPASLVLDAMRLCFLHICRGASEEIPMKWFISLLKELRGYAIEHCYCEEARKLGISWNNILKGQKSCDPMEIACFLLFHDVYQLGTIKAVHVVPLINSLDSPKQLHLVFEQIGLPEFLPDVIMRWIRMNQRIEAIRYVQALQLGYMFPIANLINEHLDHWNKQQGPNLSDLITIKQINYRLQSLKAVRTLVKDCQLESEYPIKQLEDCRNELIRRKNLIQRASSTLQQQQNKRGKVRKLETRSCVKETRACYNCGRKGHLAAACKNRAQNRDDQLIA